MANAFQNKGLIGLVVVVALFFIAWWFGNSMARIDEEPMTKSVQMTKYHDCIYNCKKSLGLSLRADEPGSELPKNPDFLKCKNNCDTLYGDKKPDANQTDKSKS